MPWLHSLRTRILLYLLLLLTAGGTASYWSATELLSEQQIRFSRHQLAKDQKRLTALLNTQQRALLQSLLDYSRWDETLDYLRKPQPQYIRSNYSSSSLDNLGIDLVIFLDRQFQMHKALEVSAGRLITLSPQDTAVTQLQTILRGIPAKRLTEGLSLTLWSREMALDLAIGPITDTDQQQAAQGWLVFARFMNPKRLSQIQTDSGVHFQLSTPRPEQTHPDAGLSLVSPLPDGLGESDVYLTVLPGPEDSYPVQIADSLLLGNTIGIIALSLLIVTLLVDHLVLRRITRLKRLVPALQDKHVPLPTGDEFKQLEHALQTTLAALQNSHSELMGELRRDPLTGLGNRKAIDECLSLFQALQQRHPSMKACIYLLDLDNFKLVNDSLGHAQGDQVLQCIAGRLVGMIRASDSAFRLGGDEFAILSLSDGDEIGMRTFAERLLETVREPLMLDGTRLTLSASLGIACSGPALCDDQLLRNADIAMYQAKHAGPGEYAFFSIRMHEQVRVRLSLEQQLRQALANGQIEVWYQPIVEAPSGRPLMLEALARWPHEGGYCPPDTFIPVAEECGLIDELGLYVARNAIQALPTLQKLQPGLQLNINLAVRQLQQPDLCQQLCTLVDGAGIERRHVHFELTESAFSEQREQLEEQLSALAREGFHLHLDDFGTGYSSLQRLQNLPMSALKLDKSFTRQLNEGDERLARIILSLGEQLQMQVIAEGVETETEYRRLRELGCTLMQGYLFARPMPEQDLSEWLQHHAQLGGAEISRVG